MIFLDASALFALVVPADPHHAVVQQEYESAEDLFVTSDYCVDELLTLLVARKRVSLAIATGWKIFNQELCQLHFLSPDQVHRAWILFQQRAATSWSFTDCTSKIVIDDLEIKTAIALDDHFRQFGNLIVVP